MSTGTSSLRRTKRRGAALVAACAAALVAALAGPAWAGSVPQPDDPPAGPRGVASPQIAEAPAKASTPEARSDTGRRNRGVDSDARRTPGCADDAGERSLRRMRTRRAARARVPGAETPTPTSTATPQPAPTHSSTATVRHRDARACRQLCAPGGCAEAETASRATGERKEAGFPGANDCRGAAGRQPPRPADRDADALVRHLRPEVGARCSQPRRSCSWPRARAASSWASPAAVSLGSREPDADPRPRAPRRPRDARAPERGSARSDTGRRHATAAAAAAGSGRT